ncbi:MAG: 2-hydroxyacid dehydrogenase [Tannerella sp.]|nr:2-hydroxyacid dehydrogenase [Tannerella sp.]
MKIAFFDTKEYDRESFNRTNERFGYDITYLETKLNVHSADMAKGADSVCAFVNDKIDAAVIDKLIRNNIKLIILRCAGYNNVDLKYAWEKIHVAHVSAYSPNAIAEHTVALLLTLTRHIHKAYNRVREGNFTLTGLVGRNLYEKTAGIIGTGKIGRITAKILSGFGMKIIAFDKFPDTAWAKENNIEYADIETLCRQSDVISLHSPLTKETHHLINEQLLSLMKREVLIINTGRGALIDTTALVYALKKRHIGGSALDVYEEEEAYFFEDRSLNVIEDDTLARLLTFPNVIITGHQAFLTNEALSAIAETSFGNIRDFFENAIIPNEICYFCDKNTCAKESQKRCW